MAKKIQGLKMPQLGKIEKIIYINQDDPVFDGSNYREDNFTVLMHNGMSAIIANAIGRKNAAKEWLDMGGEGEAPAVVIGKHIVLAYINDWSGFIDEKGEIMPPTLENKNNMYEYDTILFEKIFESYMKQTEQSIEETTEQEAVEDAMGKQEITSNGIIPTADGEQEANTVPNVE
jgi:hypothetical protein